MSKLQCSDCPKCGLRLTMVINCKEYWIYCCTSCEIKIKVESAEDELLDFLK